MRLQTSCGGLWLRKCVGKKCRRDFDAIEVGKADRKLDCHEADADKDERVDEKLVIPKSSDDGKTGITIADLEKIENGMRTDDCP
jgi:hypothetical protein